MGTDCEQVRDAFLSRLPAGQGAGFPEAVAGHLDRCAACRTELEALSRTWALLGQLPEVAPPEHLRAGLARRIRRRLLRESVLTVGGWVPAVLAAALGVGVSVALSLAVPYASLVAWCERLLATSEPHPAAYLLAGVAYGLPLALGAWTLRARALRGGLIRSLEAAVLFFLILTPYVMAECRDFLPPLRLAFVSGLGIGAGAASLAGLGLARLVHT